MNIIFRFLRQRLAGLEEGWEELGRMWENRQTLLSQGLNLQMFLRDAKQAEVMLSQQDNYLVCFHLISIKASNIMYYLRPKKKNQLHWNKLKTC